MDKKDRTQMDREINELIMSLLADPSKPPQPPAPAPAPARLEDAKTVEEVDAYLLFLSAGKPDSQ